MPIKVPDSLPARQTLENEHIFVMTEYRALHQDIRPLKIALLNLMPTKITTETQLLRCFSNTPLQIEVELIQTSTHKSKNTSADHLLQFYNVFDDIEDKYFDGMIITGAPVETLEYTDVEYWDELCRIMEWTKTHVHSTLHLCWGAQAALYYHYGIRKYPLDRKMFGIYEHRVLTPKSRLFRGFDDRFMVPHSRHTYIRREDVENEPALKLMAVSEQSGVNIISDADGHQFFMMGHPEYDATTLRDEYLRDKAKGLDIAVPDNYFPDNDPSRMPFNTWRAHANLLYTNWLNYFVYQTTPYDINNYKHDNRERQ